MVTFLKDRWSREGGFREVLVLAFPLVLSTGSWSLLHFVDRMFLSWYSPETIAAAMPSGILNFTVMSFFLGTASYVSTFIAQYHGAQMYNRIGPALWQGLYFSLIGGILVLGMIPLARPIFDLVGHAPAVRENEIVFFQYLCLGGFPAIAASALSGFFTGLGRAWPVMWVDVIATIINLILDYAMIFGNWGFPEMGMKGAAIATVISGVFSFTAYSVLISRSSYKKEFRIFSGWRPDTDLFRRLLKFGGASGVQFFLDMLGFTTFVLILGRLGTVNLAATNIAFNINTLAFMPMIGFGIAVSVLVGRYIGKGRTDLAARSTYSGFFMTFIYMSTIAVLYVAVPEIFTAPFAARSDAVVFPEIRHLTEILLRFVALYSVFDTMNVIFASAIKGAGDTRFVMFMIVLVSACVLVVPTYVAIMILGYGVMAAWVIVTLYVILLGFVFYLRFLQGNWKRMRVIEVVSAIKTIPPACSECPDTKFEP
ncbi:MAG TPA: MATE family efflux transporter [Desulfomonilia bacterium]|nr:MATE family efflux transporter [Desulfomonilia bacterium]